MGWFGVLTNAGNALLAEWALGGRTLNITGASVGSGTVPQANMRMATALNNHKMAASIAEKKKIENGVSLRIRVGPAGAAVGAFTAHEIGIWANLDGDADVLLSYHMDDDVGVSVPDEESSPEFFFDLVCPETISNENDLNITIDGDVHVSHMEFTVEKRKQLLLEEGLGGCTATPSVDENGNITGMTHIDPITGDTERTDVYTRTSGAVVEVRTLATGESLTITTDLATKATTYVFA